MGRAGRSAAVVAAPAAGPGPARGAFLAGVVETLEEDIILGRLHPRERLVEDDLIERFHASRHTIRQALMDIDRLGLIDRVPNRGAQVRSYTVEEIEQLYFLRELLETQAASLVALPMAADDLQALRAIQESHDAAVAGNDLARLMRANIAFHRQLFGCCGNGFLAEAIATLGHRAHGVRWLVLTGPAEREAARLEHHAMIAAIEERDRDRLVALCRAHLPASRDAYIRAYGQVERAGGQAGAGPAPRSPR